MSRATSSATAATEQNLRAKIAELVDQKTHLALLQLELRRNTKLRKEKLALLHGLPDYTNGYTARTTPLAREHADIIEMDISYLSGRIMYFLEYRRDNLLPDMERLMEEVSVLKIGIDIIDGKLQWRNVAEGVWRVLELAGLHER